MTGREPYFETAPLFVFLISSCGIGALACWPMVLNGSVLLFFDIEAYLSNGAVISGILSDLWQADDGQGAGGAVEDIVASGGRSIRSMVYSAYAFFGSLTPLGPVGPVVAQSSLIAALALLLVPRSVMSRPWRAVAVVAAMLLLTTWPFYSSLFMPDLLTAGIILAAMVLIRGTNRRGYMVAGLTLAFAASSHYGNLPLAVVLLVVTGVWLLVQRRMTTGAGLAMVVPVICAVGVNMAGSVVAFGEASVAPRRLPILLARSLADGPARWHLEENCDLYEYEICSAMDRFPDNVGDALWREGGLAQISSVEVLGRIRAEEPVLLWRAFLDYPAAQSWSLVRNAALQMTQIGLSDVYRGTVSIGSDGSYAVELDQDSGRDLFDALEWLHGAVVVVALIYLLVALARGGAEMERLRAVAIILFLGLVVNAMIFGGLSAPVDRYQGRVIWILPLLAALVFAARRAGHDVR